MYLSKKTCYPKQLKSPSFDKFKPRYVHFLWFYLIFVCLVILFTPNFRLNASEVARIPNQIIVKYKDPSFSPLAIAANPPSATVSSDESPSFKYTALYPGQVQVVIIEGENIQSLFEELKIDPNVEYVEPNYIKQMYDISFQRSDMPNDSDYNKQWALKSPNSPDDSGIDFLDALAFSRPSSPDDPVIIGIIDSTFSTNHPDLINQLWVNEEEIPGNGIDDDGNGYIDDINGFDFVNYQDNVIGDDDHGTHIAGICVAEKDNQIGISGVFPNAKFIPLACGSSLDSLDSFATYRAINYITDLKQRGYNIVVVNASYGSNVFSQFEYELINNLSNLGILFCTASGNQGINLEIEQDSNQNGILDSGEDINGNGNLDVSYPNNYDIPNIISVAATDINSNLANFSNYGRSKVDIAAPGSNIYSTINLLVENRVAKISLNNGSEIPYRLIEYSSLIPETGINGKIISCGFGSAEEFPLNVNGNIALIQRGSTSGVIYFYEKVTNAMNAGAIAAIIYNNTTETVNDFEWTLAEESTPPWIPAIRISLLDGMNLKSLMPLNGIIMPSIDSVDEIASYGYLSGTSMACPIVSASVAFSAHNFPQEDMIQRKNRILNNVSIINSLNGKVASGGIVNLRKIVDTDEDKLPDWWELEYFGTLFFDNIQDADNDGYSNQEEFLSKTNPIMSSDTPYFKNRLSLDNLQITSSTLEFNFIANSGYKYTIQKTDSLENPWQNQATYNGDGNFIKATITNYKTEDRSQTFYRLKASE